MKQERLVRDVKRERNHEEHGGKAHKRNRKAGESWKNDKKKRKECSEKLKPRKDEKMKNGRSSFVHTDREKDGGGERQVHEKDTFD